MKAAEINVKPSFKLMKQTDIVNFYHLQMPRMLFSNERYKSLSLEAKVAYTFLLNRFQLSRLNNWINSDNEVFVIFTRENLADEMQISYKKAIACFKELVAIGLVWERRVGRGSANQIYLAAFAESDYITDKSAPFCKADELEDCSEGESLSARPAEMAYQENEVDMADTADESDVTTQNSPREIDTAAQNKALTQDTELSNHTKGTVRHSVPRLLGCQNGTSRTAETAYPDVPKTHPNYNNKNNTDISDIKVSQSDTQKNFDRTDELEILESIIDSSEIGYLPDDVASCFTEAITRLYYSHNLKIGNATLPQVIIRQTLQKLNSHAVFDAYDKLRQNQTKIKNSTAYLMTTLYNSITECESDLLLDPYLNSLNGGGCDSNYSD